MISNHDYNPKDLRRSPTADAGIMGKRRGRREAPDDEAEDDWDNDGMPDMTRSAGHSGPAKMGPARHGRQTRSWRSILAELARAPPPSRRRCAVALLKAKGEQGADEEWRQFWATFLQQTGHTSTSMPCSCSSRREFHRATDYQALKGHCNSFTRFARNQPSIHELNDDAAWSHLNKEAQLHHVYYLVVMNLPPPDPSTSHQPPPGPSISTLDGSGSGGGRRWQDQDRKSVV